MGVMDTNVARATSDVKSYIPPTGQDALMRSRLVSDYRCSRCWCGLVELYRDGQWIVECASGGQEHGGGFVTAAFVNAQRTRDRLEAAEVSNQYAEMLNLPRVNIASASRALYGDDDELV